MGRTYLADKETLDGVNTKVGATSDTNGTASAGSIFGKLNALLTMWTSARAAKVDSTAVDAAAAKTSAAQTVTNTATSNTANEQGNLSQKLSYIITQVARLDTRVDNIEASSSDGKQKVLVSGDTRNVIPVVPTPNDGSWCRGAIYLTGPGVVHAVYNNSPNQSTIGMGLVIDGRFYEFGKANSGDMTYLAQTKTGEIMWMNGASVANSVPIRFLREFRVDVNTNGVGSSMPHLRICYETYQDI